MKNSFILCVDDERIILEALKSLLREAYGHRHLIEFAESAQEGLEILDDLYEENYVPLVIISDWLMPGMNGDEFFAKVHEKYPYVIKIMLSGYAGNSEIKRSYQKVPLYEFIAKPWDAKHLIECINRGIELFYNEHTELLKR